MQKTWKIMGLQKQSAKVPALYPTGRDAIVRRVIKMRSEKPKKLLIMNILDILRRYTDADHRLRQKDIVDILKNEYGMETDRKSIRRNILNLMDCGYDIEYGEAIRMVSELKNGLSLPKHMAEHLYMFSGESIPVTFCMKKYLMNDCIDWFGTEVTFSEETEEEVTVRVTVNREAMRHWALQYARHVRVLTPADLAQQVKEDLQAALEGYG